MDKDLQECKLCKEQLPLSLFNKNGRYKNGYYKHCKKCHYETYGRDSHYKRTYGISKKEYEEQLLKQNYKCLVCENFETEGKFGRLVVDHCHKDGGIRGLICQGCNIALGCVKDNSDTLRKLANYLDEYYGN